MHEDEKNVQNSYDQLADTTFKQSKVETELEEAKTVMKYMRFVPSLQGSIQQKKNEIATLQSNYDDIHVKVAEQTDITTQRVRALQMNEKCYDKLSDFEEQYSKQYIAWKPAFKAYSTDGSSKLGEFWTSTRALADVAHDLSMMQQECAQGVSGVSVKISPRPETCDTDTGSTCDHLECDKTRGATCAAGKCICPPGTCNDNGACRPRADPMKLPADGQVDVAVHGDAPALAGLAALVLAVAVAARRGFGREVRLAEHCLG
jgi:hypothetical protein